MDEDVSEIELLDEGTLEFKAYLYKSKYDPETVRKYAAWGICIYLILVIVTFGLVNIPVIVFGICGGICYGIIAMRKEKIRFNNVDKRLETKSYDDIDYSQMRIKVVFEHETANVYTGIFAQNVQSSKKNKYVPVGENLPLYCIPMKKNDVKSVKEVFEEITNFTKIPGEKPAISWEKMQEHIDYFTAI